MGEVTILKTYELRVKYGSVCAQYQCLMLNNKKQKKLLTAGINQPLDNDHLSTIIKD